MNAPPVMLRTLQTTTNRDGMIVWRSTMKTTNSCDLELLWNYYPFDGEQDDEISAIQVKYLPTSHLYHVRKLH